MKDWLKKLKSALITGACIVLPAWLAILLFVKALVKLGVIVKPISGHLPEEVDHPSILAFLIFILACLIIGILFHTGIGRAFGRSIEEAVLDKIPGYDSFKNIARQTKNFESEEGFKPAMIEIEDDSLSPAFLIETHDDGRCTVFVPSVPTPMAGAILVMDASRVHPVDVPVPTMMKCITKWGAGTSEILATMEKKPTQLENP